MEQNNKNIIVTKTIEFAVGIIVFAETLEANRKYVIAKQIIRSGTSIGANVNEAVSSQSKKDFVYKLSIALKESRETKYWLRLLKDSDYFEIIKFTKLNQDCDEIIKILSSIILTTKARYFKNPGATHNS